MSWHHSHTLPVPIAPIGSLSTGLGVPYARFVFKPRRPKPSPLSTITGSSSGAPDTSRSRRCSPSVGIRQAGKPSRSARHLQNAFASWKLTSAGQAHGIGTTSCTVRSRY